MRTATRSGARGRVAALAGSSRRQRAALTPSCRTPAGRRRVRAAGRPGARGRPRRLGRPPAGREERADVRGREPLPAAAPLRGGPRRHAADASGVYYLPFTLPLSVGGARGFGLHVADGSEIIVRRVGGPSLTIVRRAAVATSGTAPASRGCDAAPRGRLPADPPGRVHATAPACATRRSRSSAGCRAGGRSSASSG